MQRVAKGTVNLLRMDSAVKSCGNESKELHPDIPQEWRERNILAFFTPPSTTAGSSSSAGLPLQSEMFIVQKLQKLHLQIQVGIRQGAGDVKSLK